jgi:hypothetical protein
VEGYGADLTFVDADGQPVAASPSAAGSGTRKE